ncbi:hypothetical protein E2562_018459 [Oryza meyeriana var. granulata]|uniref:Cupin type-1 domain-containing protein n=1 Tax=Oryza meyeriana var. granulata TaxID=110450 RepID=A0A6G1EMF6_9ORYZ|nr:hypothetical protein E2562_018459 [Oryza meyeriana var. granulata]
MATTRVHYRCCFLFVALAFAVAAARVPPSFSGIAGGDDVGNVPAAFGAHSNHEFLRSPARVVIRHDVPGGQNPIHNNPSPPSIVGYPRKSGTAGSGVSYLAVIV